MGGAPESLFFIDPINGRCPAETSHFVPRPRQGFPSRSREAAVSVRAILFVPVMAGKPFRAGQRRRQGFRVVRQLLTGGGRDAGVAADLLYSPVRYRESRNRGRAARIRLCTLPRPPAMITSSVDFHVISGLLVAPFAHSPNH